MIIKRICLENFGKFNNKVIEFENGVNIIYGENEAGKTTIHTFIRGMLFGLDGKRSKVVSDDIYDKYIPWDNSEFYKGSMEIEADSVPYLIERNFLRGSKAYTITRKDNGHVLSQYEIEELFYGFDENCYYNTISISQLGSITDKELERVLKNYAANLGSTKTADISIEDAMQQLDDTREKFVKDGGLDKKVEVQREIEEIKAELKASEAERSCIVDEIEKNRESVYQLKTKNKALVELDNAQTEKQIKRSINQENLMQRIEMLTADNDRLKREQESINIQKKKIEDLLAANSVENREDVEFLIEKWLQKLNVSIFCLLLIVASLGLAAGAYYANPYIDKSDFSTWRYEMLGIGSAFIFTILFIILYFVKKARKKRMLVKLKELKVSVDKYEAVCSESRYNENLMDAKQREYNSIQFQLKAETSKPESTSDYNSEIKEIKDEISELKQVISKSQWTLEQKRESDLKLKKRLDLLSAKFERMKAVEIDIEAIDEAKQTIYDISEEVRKSFGNALNAKASQYISNITDGKYDTLKIDDNFNMAIESKFKSIPVKKLSKGTVEQIYMALRLAAADIIFDDDKKPILLDDAFVMYDNKRMANTMKFMSENLEQALMFSCHTREKVMADRIGLDYNFIKL